MKRWLVLAGLLIAGPAQANTYPNFTQGSMTSTTTTETTVTENIEIEKMGGDYSSHSGINVTASGSIGAEATTYEITTPGENFSIEIVTRNAGVVETQTITRTLDITSTTNSLSVFSQ